MNFSEMRMEQKRILGKGFASKRLIGPKYGTSTCAHLVYVDHESVAVLDATPRKSGKVRT
jgi:hypothetical protein